MKKNDIGNGVITNVTPEWTAKHTVINDEYRDAKTPCPLGIAEDGCCWGTCMYNLYDRDNGVAYCTCSRKED